MKSKPLIWVPVCAALLSCAHQPGGEDPLKNTKRLVVEGHSTLYNNGAFQVPMTTIHLIPPGPDALSLAGEMAGARAAQSFSESVKHAREAVDFAKAGIDKSVAAGKTVRGATEREAKAARSLTRFGGKAITASPQIVAGAVGASISYARKSYTATRNAGERMARESLNSAAKLSRATDKGAGALWDATLSSAGKLSKGSYAASARHANYAKERFIKGYAALPAKLGRRLDTVAESASLNRFVDAFKRSNAWRAEKSGALTEIMVDTAANYTHDVKKSFSAAAEEIKRGGEETGYTLATLKSLRWVLQGILWDATIKPVGKIAAASLGYVTVNAVAFPTLVTLNEGVAVANVAVQVVWNSAAGVYEITAPTGTAALAGIFSATELVGGQLLAGGDLALGAAASGATYAAGKSAAAATAGVGYGAGKTVQYVAAPLATVGVAAGGSAVGVVAGAAAAVGGTAVAATGVAAEGGVQVAGTTAAGAVTVVGSTASVAAGTALGAYELAKAVALPVGYEVGAGMVLSYGTLSQLSAQTVLAVSDATYLVLSMEGPRWVLYGVKGAVNDGKQLPAGAVLDLKAMQQAGETFYRVPASDEEVAKVVESAQQELPVREARSSMPNEL